MMVPRWRRTCIGSLVAVLCMPWVLGLQCQQPPPSEVNNDGFEPNDLTIEASPLVFDFSGTAVLSAILVPNDTDCYSTGPLSAGDRLVVSFSTNEGSLLNLAVAIFDASEQLFVVQDPVDSQLAPILPEVDLGIRHDSSDYFICVRQSGRVQQLAEERYSMRVTVFPGVANITPQQQTVFLNFNGSLDGPISIPNVGSFVLPAFDATQLSPSFAGLSDQLKDQIQLVIEQRFADFNLRVLNSDDNARPTNQAFAIVHFGGYRASSQGAAQLIDTYNAVKDDQAIVFTDDWVNDYPRGFNLQDSEVTVGEVACRLIGQLIGLQDVNNPGDLMDFLQDGVVLPPALYAQGRTFQSSILDEEVWPFGFQNGPQLLLEILGPAPPQPP
jgi:hypothetical protein